MLRTIPLIVATFIAICSLSLHFPETSLSAKQLTTKTRGHETSIGVGSGVAIFQDIQVPINEEAGVRGDGKLPAEEYQNHTGLSLQAHAYRTWNYDRLGYTLGFDATQARSTDGPAATQSSSYTRLNLSGGVSYWLTREWNAGLLLGLRRSAYNNVSTGHFINSLLTGLNTHVDISRDWGFDFSVLAAPQSNFHYDSGASFSGNRFQNSRTSLGEYKVVSTHRLYQRTWLTLGLSQEVAKVEITDVAEYDTFGLNVSPTTQSSRVYDLSTTLLTIGFDKRF